MISVAGFGQSVKKKKVKDAPVFSQVVYQGSDPVYDANLLKVDEFYNPILQGCYPDPSITKKGDDYFLVCSSFAMFPGVPIFHSKDLVNWTQIGHVLDRTSQLKVHDTGISAGVYAPVIRYNANNDTFYMITTQFAGGFGNIIVKSKDPFKGWSDPIKLNFDGIDPSIFFDDNGKAYVVHNDGPKREDELYNGHRVIKVWEYDVENDQVIAGTDKVIVNGGVDLSKKPIWIEAPHIYKKDGRYYLMCAEGGTGDWHSEVIFVSDDPKGPFIPAPSNPILSQRYLNDHRMNKVDWAGHADLVEGPDGKYYGVFLAVRPNEQRRVNTGRETFILPVDWSGMFPVFENGLVPFEAKLKVPVGVENKTGKDGYFPNGNFTFTENFTSPQLDYRWIGLRGPREDFASVLKDGGLQIVPFAVNMNEVKPTSTLFHRQQHTNFSFTTTMVYTPKTEQDLAGIACVQSEDFHYIFGVTKQGKDYYLVLERTEKGKSAALASTKIDVKNPLQLQVKAVGDNYDFSYSTDGTNFVQLGNTVSGDILSTNIAGGFTGCLLGLYATSVHPKAVSLKDAYADYFTVGCAINMANLNSPGQMSLIATHFNSITAENDMKPQPIQPSEGQWNWTQADNIADFARANNIGLRGHCLAWHNQTAEWMYQDEKGEPVSKEVLFERMRTHIHAIVNRYKDVIYAWDVVNEAITDDANAEVPYRLSTYYKIAGDEFIKKAFEYAHEADPKALLFYNDYNETNPAKRDRIYNMVKSMKAEGVPITGIGMQGHYNVASPTEGEFKAAIELYSQVVDHIHITELDVRINTGEQGGHLMVNQNGAPQLTLTREAEAAQVAQYDMLFRVLRDHKDVVSNVTFWNVYDGDSWLDRRRGNRQRNYPLLFDNRLMPKASFYKVALF